MLWFVACQAMAQHAPTKHWGLQTVLQPWSGKILDRGGLFGAVGRTGLAKRTCPYGGLFGLVGVSDRLTFFLGRDGENPSFWAKRPAKHWILCCAPTMIGVEHSQNI